MTAIPSKKCTEEATHVMVGHPRTNSGREGAVWKPLCGRHVKDVIPGAIVREVNDWDRNRKAIIDKRHRETYGSPHKDDGKIICTDRDRIPGAFGAPPPVPPSRRDAAWHRRMNAYREQMERLRRENKL